MNRRPSMRRAVRFVLVAAVVVLMGVAALYGSHHTLISYAQGDGQISREVKGNKESWRIRQPNVRQHITPYPQIRFQPGDRITIEAGGCVQTGGIGKTWKHYVNPRGPNADRLYHGLIWIPGVIGCPAASGVPPTPKRLDAYLGPSQAVV